MSPDNTSVTINISTGQKDSSGFDIMIDDIELVEGVDVVVGKAQESEFAKQMRRDNAAFMRQSMQPTPTNIEMLTTLEGNYILNMEYTSDEDKKYAEEVVKRSKELSRLQMEAQIWNLRVQIESAKLQGTQVQAQQQVAGVMGATQQNMAYANFLQSEQMLQMQSQPQPQVMPGQAPQGQIPQQQAVA